MPLESEALTNAQLVALWRETRATYARGPVILASVMDLGSRLAAALSAQPSEVERARIDRDAAHAHACEASIEERLQRERAEKAEAEGERLKVELAESKRRMGRLFDSLADAAVALDQRTSPPAPSGWQQRIADEEMDTLAGRQAASAWARYQGYRRNAIAPRSALEAVVHMAVIDALKDAIPKVGCEREDGLLNIHSEADTCEVCAPVVAKDALPPAPEGSLGKETDNRDLALAIIKRCAAYVRGYMAPPPASADWNHRAEWLRWQDCARMLEAQPNAIIATAVAEADASPKEPRE